MDVSSGPQAPDSAAIKIIFKGEWVQHICFWKGNGDVEHFVCVNVCDVVVRIIQKAGILVEPRQKVVNVVHVCAVDEKNRKRN